MEKIISREYFIVDEEEYNPISQVIKPKNNQISIDELRELYSMYKEEKQFDKKNHIFMGVICCRETTYKDKAGQLCCYQEYCKPRKLKNGGVRFKWN